MNKLNPDELIIELSRNCNLSCIMCGFGGGQIKNEWFMDLGLFEKVIMEFGLEVKVIRLNGRGESTIHPDFIDLVEMTRLYCPSASLHMFTNLSWDEQAILDIFKKYNFQLFISIDSPEDSLLKNIRRGCRPDLIKNNLEALNSLEVRPFIVATLQELNLYQVRELATFAVKYRCNLIFNTVRFDEGSPEFDAMVINIRDKLVEDFMVAKDILSECNLMCYFPDQIHGIPIYGGGPSITTGGGSLCPSLNHEIFITYSGKVQPCNMFHPYELGDLQIQSMDKIRTSPRWHWFEMHHFESSYCKNCAYLRAEV